MVRQYHRLNGHKSNSGGQRNLACCSPWGHRVGHDLLTEQQKQFKISTLNLGIFEDDFHHLCSVSLTPPHPVFTPLCPLLPCSLTCLAIPLASCDPAQLDLWLLPDTPRLYFLVLPLKHPSLLSPVLQTALGEQFPHPGFDSKHLKVSLHHNQSGLV